MAGVGEVISFERHDEGDVVKVDLGGNDVQTAEHFEAAGSDSVPLAGDSAALTEGVGEGALQVAGYDDPSAKKSSPGEKRIYARNSSGAVVAEIWIRNNGDIEITSMASGVIKMNGVEIDQDGNITAPGEITAKAGTPASVTVSQHLHPTAMGPSGAPTPGT